MPGSGENFRVLKWIVERLDGTAAAVNTAIGYVPSLDTIDTAGLGDDRVHLATAVRVDTAEWVPEIARIVEWFAKFGDKLRAMPGSELDFLNARLNAR